MENKKKPVNLADQVWKQLHDKARMPTGDQHPRPYLGLYNSLYINLYTNLRSHLRFHLHDQYKKGFK